MGVFIDWHPLETDLLDALAELEVGHWADRPRLVARVEHLQRALAWCDAVRPNYKDEVKPWWHWRKRGQSGFYHSSQCVPNKLVKQQPVQLHTHQTHHTVQHIPHPVYHHGQRSHSPSQQNRQAEQMAHLAARVHQLSLELAHERDKRRALLQHSTHRPPLFGHRGQSYESCTGRRSGHQRYAATMGAQPHVHFC